MTDASAVAANANMACDLSLTPSELALDADEAEELAAQMLARSQLDLGHPGTPSSTVVEPAAINGVRGSWERPPSPTIPHAHQLPKSRSVDALVPKPTLGPPRPSSRHATSLSRLPSRPSVSAMGARYRCGSPFSSGSASTAALFGTRPSTTGTDSVGWRRAARNASTAPRAPPKYLSPRERRQQRTERELDDRLAAAAAMLQSMHAPSLQQQSLPTTPKLDPRQYRARQLETIGGESILGSGFGEQGGPTSNDRLRMILYDLMSH